MTTALGPIPDSEMCDPPTSPSAIGRDASPGWLSLPQMRYPNEYVWFLLFSSMDIMLTWVILVIGGREVNPIAAIVISAWGLPGAIGFKFSLTLLVVIMCEIVGRHRHHMAKNLAQLAVAISATPVLYSMGLMAVHVALM